VLDFTSALYLGLRHPSGSLRPWRALTAGKPAVLETPAEADAVAAGLAALTGCERATLSASTLHLYWDLFGILARDRVRIYMDRDCYPIAGWGVERSAASGAPLHRFPHRDAARLRLMIERGDGSGARPVIVADGLCPSCGKPAPLAGYLACVERRDGLVVIDDSQALGILGEDASAEVPYGHGGGGSLKFHGIDSARIVLGNSLAKAFGAPLAVLAASAAIVRKFEDLGDTRVHCSPPSAAALHAAERALTVNRTHGDRWRGYLAGLVRRFRVRLAEVGVAAEGGMFPMIGVRPHGIDAAALQARLLARGIRAAATRGCRDAGATVAFLVTALHDPADIDRAAEALGEILVPVRGTSKMTGRLP
jgi:8-amino-7-oxononanoate synthase